jgi:hypothetical protein
MKKFANFFLKRWAVVFHYVLSYLQRSIDQFIGEESLIDRIRLHETYLSNSATVSGGKAVNQRTTACHYCSYHDRHAKILRTLSVKLPFRYQ